MIRAETESPVCSSSSRQRWHRTSRSTCDTPNYLWPSLAVSAKRPSCFRSMSLDLFRVFLPQFFNQSQVSARCSAVCRRIYMNEILRHSWESGHVQQVHFLRLNLEPHTSSMSRTPDLCRISTVYLWPASNLCAQAYDRNMLPLAAARLCRGYNITMGYSFSLPIEALLVDKIW